MTFLTVWILAKTALADLAPQVIQSSDDMRVPTTGAEYRHLALDICTIYFFAISFYFCLMFAVAHDTYNVTEALEHFEGIPHTPRSKAAKANASLRRASTSKISAATMGSIATGDQEFIVVKQYFVHHM